MKEDNCLQVQVVEAFLLWDSLPFSFIFRLVTGPYVLMLDKTEEEVLLKVGDTENGTNNDGLECIWV